MCFPKVHSGLLNIDTNKDLHPIRWYTGGEKSNSMCRKWNDMWTDALTIEYICLQFTSPQHEHTSRWTVILWFLNHKWEDDSLRTNIKLLQHDGSSLDPRTWCFVCVGFVCLFLVFVCFFKSHNNGHSFPSLLFRTTSCEAEQND